MSGLTAASLGSLGVPPLDLEGRAADDYNACRRRYPNASPGTHDPCLDKFLLMQEEKRRNAAKIAAYEAALAAEAAAGIAPAPRKPVASVVQDLSPYPGFAPQGPVYGPASPADVAAARADWVKENPTPTDTALTQRVVAQNNLSNQQATTRPRSALSAHAQAAKIRGQWAANRAPAPSYPRPMTAPRQNQLILATQAQQGGLGTGAKIAVAGLAAVAILSLGALLFGGR